MFNFNVCHHDQDLTEAYLESDGDVSHTVMFNAKPGSVRVLAYADSCWRGVCISRATCMETNNAIRGIYSDRIEYNY